MDKTLKEKLFALRQKKLAQTQEKIRAEGLLDEDDYGRLMADSRFQCPYYTDDDEYKVVRHQN